MKISFIPSCFFSSVFTTVLISFITISPALSATDFDATYIERTPRYDYDAAKNMPAPGDIVTFHGHIMNWSDTLQEIEYVFLIDDDIADWDIIILDPQTEGIVTTEWQWSDGPHTVELIVDPEDFVAEDSENNNFLADRTDAIIAGFWVEQSLYDYFHANQYKLGIGSNSWPDWIQRQMAKQNELYETAIWPNTPNGVLDRVRIDKITIVPDGALPLNGGLPTNHPDLSDKTVDLMWGFTTDGLNGTFYSNHTSTSEDNPFYIEKSLIHELGHARYLIDCYGFDTHNTSSHHSVQIWEGDTYVAGSSYMPFIAWGEVLYYNKSGGVMTGPYGFAWSPYEAEALNLIAGQRATCGNANAPCNIGVFLQDLPENNHVRFVDTSGTPWAGANVRIYQSKAGPGWYGKTIDNTPDQQYYTDSDGYVHLPRNPFNPGGDIIHTYGHANSVFVFRVEYAGQIWYRFMEVPDFNMQYWHGNTTNAYYSIELDGINIPDTQPPTDPTNLTATEITYESVSLDWVASTDDIGVNGYYVYRDEIEIDTTTTNSYVDTGISSCNSYSYTVRAYDSANQSGLSNQLSVDIPAAPQTADLNNDLIVDLLDLTILANNWLQSQCGITGDITGDSKVNMLDFAYISLNYGIETIIDNWQMKQKDMHNTGRAFFTVPASKLNGTFFDDIIWQKPTPNSPGEGNLSATSMSFFASVGPDGEDIVLGSYHWPKGIQGMDRHTGKLFWFDNTPGGESIAKMAPAFSNDGQTVYLTSDATDGELMAFETAVGPANFWDTSADTSSRLNMTSPTISPDGRIWLHDWNDRPYAGTDYGTAITSSWAADTAVSACYSDPALFDDNGTMLVISGGRQNIVRCWDGDTGEQLWDAPTGGHGTDANATIDPANGNIYLPVGDNSIYIVGLNKDGQPLWDDDSVLVYEYHEGVNYRQRAQSAGCLSHDSSTYYFQTNSNNGDGTLYAINTIDGSVKWSYPTHSLGWEIHSSSPIVTLNNVIIVGNNENDTYFAIKDTASGPVLLDTLQVEPDGVAQASPTLSADGILYLPLRIVWNQSNGDNDSPSGETENLFTAFDLTDE